MATFSERILLLIDAQASGAIGSLGHLEKQAKDTDTSFGKLQKSAGLTGSSLRAGLANLAPAALTGGLVAGLTLVVTKYTQAAEAANLLSQATNSSVEDASRFAAVASRYGLGTSDLVEIFADFQQAAKASGDELEKLGVTMVKTPSGSTDWIATATDFLGVLQKIPDATERNRLMFKYFGEEGAKQLMSLVNSGQSVEDALNAIQDTQILHEADIQNVQEFKNALFGVEGVGGGLANTLGRVLLPAITDVINVFTPLLGVLAEIPTEVFLVVGALVALNAALKVGAVQNMLGLFAALATGAVSMSTVVVGAFDAMTAAIMANPFGLVIIGVAAAVAGLAVADKKYREGLHETAVEILKLTEAGKSYEEAVAQIEGKTVDKVRAEKLANDSSAEVYGTNVTVTKTLDAQDKAYNDLVDDIGEFGAAELIASENTKSLNDMLAEGEYTTEELRKAVEDAGRAQREQNQITEQSTALLDMYAASTWDAVNATEDLFESTFSLHDATKDFHETLKENVKVLGDTKKGSDEWVEANDNIMESALNVASATAEQQKAQDELNGVYHDASYYTQIQIDELKELADQPGVPKSVHDSIYNNLIDPLEEAQQQSGEGIWIDGIHIAPGHTAEEVEAKKAEIEQSIKDHNYGLTSVLEAELAGWTVDETDLPDIPPMPVTLVGSDGAALDKDIDVAVNVDTSGVDTAKTSVAGLGEPSEYTIVYNTDVSNDENTLNVLKGLAEPSKFTIEYTTDVSNDENTRNVLKGLAEPKKYTVEYNTDVTNDENTRNVLKGLAEPKKYVIEYNADVTNDNNTENVLKGLANPDVYHIEYNTDVTNDENTRNVLNGLDGDRYVTIHVSTTGLTAAQEAINGLGRTSSMSGLLGPSATATDSSSANRVVTQNFNISVDGAGSPAVTAREIDRYIRRAGDPRKVSVTA